MHLKGILRVELIETDNSDRNNTVHVSYSISDSVLSIKHKLHQLTGIPADSQTLYHPAVYLSDVTPVHLLSRSSDSIPTIRMHVVARGGASRPCNGFQPFIFKDITSEECFEHCEFSERSPYYCIIDKGFCIQAICQNPFCDSARQGGVVFINKGMYPYQGGYVAIRTEVMKLMCPACDIKIPSQNWQNIIFNSCVAEIEWILTDESFGRVTLVTQDGKFIQAKPNNGEKEYHSLDMWLK